MGCFLLHTCCGPCATSAIERLLREGTKPVLFFDNPNIFPNEEREKRRDTLHTVAKHYNLDVIDGYTPHEEWLSYINGFEEEKEGGERCKKCFYFNAMLAHKKLEECRFEKFSTTLTVSRFKNSNKVFAEFSGFPKFAAIDFKKQDGFALSCRLSNELHLYRQHYCGCEFSIKTATTETEVAE